MLASRLIIAYLIMMSGDSRSQPPCTHHLASVQVDGSTVRLCLGETRTEIVKSLVSDQLAIPGMAIVRSDGLEYILNFTRDGAISETLSEAQVIRREVDETTIESLVRQFKLRYGQGATTQPCPAQDEFGKSFEPCMQFRVVLNDKYDIETMFGAYRQRNPQTGKESQTFLLKRKLVRR